MGDCSDVPVELTEEQMDEFNTKRGEAMAAFSEADWPNAVGLFTEAIKINSGYVKTARIYILSMPNLKFSLCKIQISLNPTM